MAISEYDIRYPENNTSLDQDEEWITLVRNNKNEKIRLHDYDRFFKIPGLYEEVLYRELKCCSPITICSLLHEKISKSDESDQPIRVLDFGAGNGMIGECLKKTVKCEKIVGFDILEQARDAAMRDYPGIYDDYYVLDLSQLKKEERANLKKWRFDALVTVAALGYGDIPALAFMNAFNLIEKKGWIAFNIKERFISSNDGTGFQKLVDHLAHDCMELMTFQRYCHRLSLSGKPLYYYAVIGRKTADISSPERIIQTLESVPN